MNEFLTADFWQRLYQTSYHWLQINVLTFGTLTQIVIIVVAMVIAFMIAPSIKSALQNWHPKNTVTAYFQPMARLIARIGLPVIFLILTSMLLLLVYVLGWPFRLLMIINNLLLAWVVIEIATGFVINEFWRKVIAIFAWSVAALNIIGLLDATIQVMNATALTIGTIHISALGIVKSILTLIVLLWLAIFCSDLFERQISTSRNISPSIQVLFSKLVKILAITVALLFALSSLGIDLTAFAVFSGAIGVGIGFGLQKIFSNLVSGVILLLDKSIKPGDVIAIDNYYGKVDSLGARYVAIITRDGSEYLIPNENLVTGQVENWSHTNNLVRLKLPVGVHYKSDVHKAIALCLEAADEVDRVLKDPKSVCLLKGFGDSSVDLELRFWINDPMNGRANVMSQILLKIWDKFHQHDIEIPYPQRDLHVRSVDPELSEFHVFNTKTD